MMFGWFGQVITESWRHVQRQVDMSFRWGMGWFIFSEVMFFAAFFGALFYARSISIPWLDGGSNNDATALLPVARFRGRLAAADGALAEKFGGAKQAMGPWGLPALNTAILLTSRRDRYAGALGAEA